MVQLGEVSAGRQALDGACLAPGDLKTLNALKDSTRRPPVPRDPLPDSVAQCEPEERFSLSQELFFQNVRMARKGAAPGPSGMTADHLRPLLRHNLVATALGHAALLLAQNRVLEEVMNALRCGRTAFRKPEGGVRGIVVGDVFRRVVARRLRNSTPKRWKRPRHPIRTHSRRKLGARQWPTFSRFSPIWTPMPLSSLLMVSGHLTSFLGTP